MTIRDAEPHDIAKILAVINAAAEKYKGEVPADCLHSPYMSEAELRADIAAGIRFRVIGDGEHLIAALGRQVVKGMNLIRHAYVAPPHQGKGAGSQLLQDAIRSLHGDVLVGTWAAAEWAIAFYQRNNFVLQSTPDTVRLLKTYWTVPDRQVETSVVLRLERPV